MSPLEFGVSIDIEETLKAFDAIFSRFSEADPFLSQVGELAEMDATHRIMHTKEAPDGTPWAPWTPYTESQRILGFNALQGLLWDTGNLLDSIHHETDGNTVEIGTDVSYALDLQDGIPGTMEPRPFLGWSPSLEREVLHLANVYFGGL